MENRIKIFIDTNIIITGTFFSGYESLLIKISGADFVTADVCLEEARNVTSRSNFKDDTSIALKKLENTFMVLKVINAEKYSYLLPRAKFLIPKKINDQRVLAAAMHLQPNYFVSRDTDFDKKNIKQILNMKTAEEILSELGVL